MSTEQLITRGRQLWQWDHRSCSMIHCENWLNVIRKAQTNVTTKIKRRISVVVTVRDSQSSLPGDGIWTIRQSQHTEHGSLSFMAWTIQGPELLGQVFRTRRSPFHHVSQEIKIRLSLMIIMWHIIDFCQRTVFFMEEVRGHDVVPLFQDSSAEWKNHRGGSVKYS